MPRIVPLTHFLESHTRYDNIYVCTLKLAGHLTFSSSISVTTIPSRRGKDAAFTVYKPAMVIHNYPLMYAFSGYAHGSLVSFRISHTQVLKGEVPPPEYTLMKEITNRLYVYPARPRHILLDRMLAVATGEHIVQHVGQPKAMYPWRVIHYYFLPGSIFETVVLTKNGVRLPRTIRLGVKRQGVFEVSCRRAVVKGEIEAYTDPVNIADVEAWGYKPKSYITLLEPKSPEPPIGRVLVNASVISGGGAKDAPEFILPLPK